MTTWIGHDRQRRDVNPSQFTTTPYDHADEKRRFFTKMTRFLEKGCPETLFTKSLLYKHLHLHLFGHIAEFNAQGFYGVWFSTPERRAHWVEYARRGGAYGFNDYIERTDLWGDVEHALANWLDDSGVGDRLVEAGRSNTEQAERALLRELLARYPDEAAR